MLGSPASTRKAERLTTALVTYGCIFVEGRGHPRVPRGRSAGTRPCLVHTDVGRLTRLTTVLRRSQSEQSPPDGIASLSVPT
jgi:hypothetical protein